MPVRIWRSGIVLCCLVAGLAVTGGRQAQPRNDDHAAHLRAAKNAARFDWTGVLEEAGITRAGRDDAVWKNILNMVRRFASDEVAGARVMASFEGLQVETTADPGLTATLTFAGASDRRTLTLAGKEGL